MRPEFGLAQFRLETIDERAGTAPLGLVKVDAALKNPGSCLNTNFTSTGLWLTHKQ
jgi:hypothetical protein